jgi:hypothetical protein
MKLDTAQKLATLTCSQLAMALRARGYTVSAGAFRRVMSVDIREKDVYYVVEMYEDASHVDTFEGNLFVFEQNGVILADY